MPDKKKIEEYLHLYIGCEVIGKLNDEPRKGRLTGVTNGGYECEIQFFNEDGINVSEEPEWNESKDVILLLRPISEMTDKEKEEILRLDEEDKLIVTTHFQTVRKLLKEEFDLFELVADGLAQQKPTVNNGKETIR